MPRLPAIPETWRWPAVSRRCGQRRPSRRNEAGATTRAARSARGPSEGRGEAYAVRRRRFTDLFCLLLLAWVASAPASAAAFGTIDSGGQHREHERITRAALACAGTGFG